MFGSGEDSRVVQWCPSMGQVLKRTTEGYIWGLCTFVFLVINVLPFAEKVRTVYVSIRLADPGSVAIDPILF